MVAVPAHASDAVVKIARPIIRMRRRPSRSAARPPRRKPPKGQAVGGHSRGSGQLQSSYSLAGHDDREIDDGDERSQPALVNARQRCVGTCSIAVTLIPPGWLSRSCPRDGTIRQIARSRTGTEPPLRSEWSAQLPRRTNRPAGTDARPLLLQHCTSDFAGPGYLSRLPKLLPRIGTGIASPGGTATTYPGSACRQRG